MKTAKRSLAMLMALVMMFTMLGTVAVSAASVDELRIEMVEGKLIVYKNDKKFKSYSADEAEGIKLSRSAKTDKIVITFVDSNGKTRNIALAQDANISVDGTMSSITLNKSLGNTTVAVAQTAVVETLTVKNSGEVAVAGTITNVDVTTKAANISMSETAAVTTVTAPKEVVVTGDGAKNVAETIVSTSKKDEKPTQPVPNPVNPSNPIYNWQDMSSGGSGNQPVPTAESLALSAVNAAVNDAQVQAFLNSHAATCGINLGVYNQLDATMQAAARAALLPSSFSSTNAVKSAFDAAVLAQKNGAKAILATNGTPFGYYSSVPGALAALPNNTTRYELQIFGDFTVAANTTFAIGANADIVIMAGSFINDGTVTLANGGTITGRAANCKVQNNGATFGNSTLTFDGSSSFTWNTASSAWVKDSTATLTSIAITKPATKLVYAVGDSLDITGLEVTGTYSDNATKVETITAANVTGFNSTQVVASQTLTITVGGKTATYTIAIGSATVPATATVSGTPQLTAMTAETTSFTLATTDIADGTAITVSGLPAGVTQATATTTSNSTTVILQGTTTTPFAASTSMAVAITGFSGTVTGSPISLTMVKKQAGAFTIEPLYGTFTTFTVTSEDVGTLLPANFTITFDGTSITATNVAAYTSGGYIVTIPSQTADGIKELSVTMAGTLTNHLPHASAVKATPTTSPLTPSTITFTDAAPSNVYDTAKYTNAVSGDGDGAITYSSGTTTVATVDPTSGEVTLAGVGSTVISATKAATATHSAVTATYTLTVTAKPLTIAAPAATNKVYNGNADVLLTGSLATGGVINGDTVTLTALTGTTADANVGTGKAVTTAYGLTGAKAANYQITQPTTVTVDISAAPLTVTGVTATSRLYDGTKEVDLGGTATLSGAVSGETPILDTQPAPGTMDDADIGNNKLVTVAYELSSATVNGNYTLTQPTVTVNITPVELTVTGVTAEIRDYDGTTTVNLIGSATLSGAVNGERPILVDTQPAQGTMADANAGYDKPVTVAYALSDDPVNGNYTLKQPAITVTITPKPLSLSINTPSGTFSTIDAVMEDLGTLGSEAFNVTYAGKSVRIYAVATYAEGKYVLDIDKQVADGTKQLSVEISMNAISQNYTPPFSPAVVTPLP